MLVHVPIQFVYRHCLSAAHRELAQQLDLSHFRFVGHDPAHFLLDTKIIVPSVTAALRKIHFDIEREQAIKQLSLAIIMPGREPGVGYLFAAVLQESEP